MMSAYFDDFRISISLRQRQTNQATVVRLFDAVKFYSLSFSLCAFRVQVRLKIARIAAISINSTFIAYFYGKSEKKKKLSSWKD